MPTSTPRTAVPVLESKPVHVRQKDGTIITYPGKPVIGSEFSTTVAAEILGLSIRTITRQCKQGLFKTANKSGVASTSPWKIARSEVEARLSRGRD